MRLIDADELPEVNTIERIDGEREVFANSWIPAAAIWKAPTVEAIPVEWLEEYMVKWPSLLNTELPSVIEYWREENEQSNTGD